MSKVDDGVAASFAPRSLDADPGQRRDAIEEGDGGPQADPIEKLLDLSLAATFPASDPLSITQPAARTASLHQLPEGESMTVNIGLSDTQRQAAARILNTALADEFVLYVKSRRFHWNVEGPNFSELHNLFEKQYEELDQIIDQVAERARMLGEIAVGSLEEYLKSTRLAEQAKTLDANSMIAALLEDHESIIRCLRQDIETASREHGDQGTADFLTGLMRAHEKMSWMLRAYLR